MNVSKSVDVILLAGVVAMLSVGPTRAQTAAPPPAAAKAEAPLPKDIYPDSRGRLPVARREDMDEEGKRIFDESTRKLNKPGEAPPAGFLPTTSPQPRVRLWDPKLGK